MAEKAKKPAKRHPMDTLHVRHARGKFPDSVSEKPKGKNAEKSKKD